MGHEARVSAEKRVGTRLDGKWHLEALLGYGGSAAVYAATHRNGKRAAIKVLHRHCSADEALVARFVREGYLANKINHPGVVSILDDDVSEDGLVFLVMELLEGRSLDRCGRGLDPPLSIAEVIRVADELLDILVVAHELGLIHRDIKPANLFITTTGQVKILDFGIARLAEPSVEATVTGMMMGTPAFMPPEQALGRWSDVDARSDIWAVGATLIALLLGRRPRVAETPNEELLMSMTQPLPSLTTLMPDAPPWLVKVIDKAVAFERADRFQTAREMQLAIRAGANEPEPDRIISRPPTPSVTIALANVPIPPPPRSTNTIPQQNTVALAHPPVLVLPEPEPPPSLTTHRAVLHSAPPPPRAARSTGAAGWIVAVATTFAFVVVVLGVLWSRSMLGPLSKRASAASPEPPPSATTPPPAVTHEPPPVPATPASVTEGPSLPPSGTGSVREPHKAAPRVAKPAGSDPSKYFDSRF